MSSRATDAPPPDDASADAQADRAGEASPTPQGSCGADAAAMALTIVDPAGVVTSHHGGGPGMAGEDLVGRSIFTVLGRRPELAASWQRVLAGEEFVTRVAAEGGSVYQTVFVPLRNRAGEIEGALCAATDVTKEERARELLSESEAYFRRITKAVSDYTYVVRVEDGRPTETVHAASCADITGYSQEDFQADPYLWVNMIPEADRPAVLQQVTAVLEGGCPPPVEHRLVRKDGSEIWVESRLVPHAHADGRLREYAGVVSDITERKRAEAAAAQRQRVIEAVYELATSGRTGSLEELCDATARMLAEFLSASAAILYTRKGDRLSVVSSWVDGRHHRKGEVSAETELCRLVIETGRAERRVEPAGLPALPPVDAQQAGAYAGMPILDRKNRVVGLIAALREDPAPFADEHLQVMEIFARHIGFEFERDRLERELRSAEQGRLLGQVASGVAHEVRNPLNAIGVAVETLAHHLEGEGKYERYLERVRRQTARLTNLMQDLLQFRRPLTVKKMEVRPLADICRQAVDTWKEGANDGHEVTVHDDAKQNALAVRVDPERISQALVNLLDNASQHSPEASPIQVRLATPESGWAAIQVRDAGSGIPADKLDRVFDPFFTTRKAGSGLGLNLVRMIAEKHGGRAAIHNNTDGPGCTVELVLPLAEEAAPQAQEQASASRES